MTDARAEAVSIADRVHAVKAEAPVVGVHFLGNEAAFVLGEETLLFVAADATERRVPVHAGGILASAADAARIISGGDDGKLVATDAAGASRTIAADAKRR